MQRPRAVLLAAAMILCGAAPAPAADFIAHRDLAYAEPKSPRQCVDVYAPATGTNHPVVVWVHGGGWMRGDKAEDMAVKPAAFTGSGFVLVSVNYRLIPEVTIREMAGDVAKAIAWTRTHAKDFGGDPGSIFLVGHSAGAQLVALICTDGSYLKADGLSLGDIKGCVPIDGGTYYPPLMIDRSTPHTVASFRLKFPDAGSEKAYAAVLHVAPGKGIPPFLLIYADHPETGTPLQAEIFAEVLREANVPAELFTTAGKTHVRLNTELGLPGDKPTEAIFRFIDAQLHEKKSQ